MGFYPTFCGRCNRKVLVHVHEGGECKRATLISLFLREASIVCFVRRLVGWGASSERNKKIVTRRFADGFDIQKLLGY